MPFSGNDFFDVGDTLAQAADEGSKRSAMGRYYYGVFHLARAICNQNPTKKQITENSSSHGEIFDRLAVGHPAIATDCRTLHALRKLADYRDVYPNNLDSDLIDAADLATRVRTALALIAVGTV